jgi:hypothetical protein
MKHEITVETNRAQWARIEAALDEILALPETQWPEASARLAGGDTALLAEIESLLACSGGIRCWIARSPMRILG